MKMHTSHRPCLFALAALLARSRTIDLRGNVTHTGNLGSVPSRWLGGSVVRWLGSCANPQPETRTSRPENEGLVPEVPVPKCRIIRKEQANIMQIACAVAGSVPKFSDSCTGEKQFKQCATLSVSVFAGKCFSIGPWIKHCFSVDGTYSYSDCNSKPNEFSIWVSWQQCYGWKHAGACVSTRWSPWSKSW